MRRATSRPAGPGGPLLTMAALNLGNNHYFLSGRITDPLEPGSIEPVFGNLEVKGGKLYMTRWPG